MVIGGSACPAAMMKAFVETYGSDVVHAWGMTEMSPDRLAVDGNCADGRIGTGRTLDPEAEAGPRRPSGSR